MKKIIISGASGLVGQQLQKYLPANEWTVVTIGRGDSADVCWNPDEGVFDESEKLEDAYAFIHLAGESIAAKRWSDKQKEYILNNRNACAKLAAKICEKYHIKNILTASAIGFYGHRPNEVCTEDTGIGQGFTCDVCSEIEGAFMPLKQKKFRTVFMRFGVVLSSNGGALPKMALPFKLFGGGPVGNGSQKVSWVDINDVCLAILYILKNSKLEGPVNIVSPETVTNAQLGKTIAQQLNRPYWFPFPAFAVKLILGNMGKSLLLDSCEVKPEKLEKNGFHFSYPNIKNSLKHQYK